MSKEIVIDPRADNSPLEPRRAPVVPRVRVAVEGAVLPLEHHVRGIYASGLFRRINLVGRAGSGKTTALRHLAAVLPPEISVRFEDEWVELGDRLSVFTSHQPTDESDCIVLEMTPWTQDDLIEYCAAVHRDRCASILGRALKSPQSMAAIGGLPEIWRVTLDALAEDESLEDPDSALGRALEKLIPDRAQRALAGDACLEAMRKGYAPMLPASRALDQIPRGAFRLLRHLPSQNLLRASRLISLLENGNGAKTLAHQLPPELVVECGRQLRDRPSAIEHLRTLANGRRRALQPMSASLLHYAGEAWRPPEGRPANLQRAYLVDIRWREARLLAANVRSADLRGADFSHADCTKLRAEAANFEGANLHSARLTEAGLATANLARCNLSSIDAAGCCLDQAILCGALLENANLCGVSFVEANLTNARLGGAKLVKAIFGQTKWEEADFSGADLTEAVFRRLALKVAGFSGACFHLASFYDCDLSGMNLPGANFHGALMGRSDLTATVMPGADWTEASLRGCGLAEVEWEGADMRSVDFSNASFHMGSTRSGLVGSVIASEGTRTGFYTDDYLDQDYKPPEEIRKANLCRCNLRGAKVEKTDWYLVDLRGANYTRKQAEHFARCGAILRDRAGS